jgi:hypothetical protein
MLEYWNIGQMGIGILPFETHYSIVPGIHMIVNLRAKSLWHFYFVFYSEIGD